MSLSLREKIYSIACRRRRRFFQLWNQLADSEWVFASLEEKIERVLGAWERESEEEWIRPGLEASVRFISLLDEDYPSALRDLPQPPLGLFVSGEISPSQNWVSVIGSRKPTSYALRMCRRVVLEWVQAGRGIVSGGALGIDGEAHWAAYEAGGQSLVILGGGHRHLYPPRHLGLFQKLLESKQGALISEYPPWVEARHYHFPERNRLIAALGEQLFIAQAHEKSGSLHTARTAMDLGKEIFVLRPLPEDENFAGSAELIESGAHCLSQPKDLHLLG